MTASIIGGGQVNFALDATQTALAAAALTAAFTAGGYSVGNVITDLGGSPIGGDYNTYNIEDMLGDGGTDTLAAGAQAFVLLGTNNEIIVGNGGDDVLVGNYGNDTIDAVGGSGTIVTGTGANVINLNTAGVAGGSLTIDTGAGDGQGAGTDIVNMWGGAVTVSAETGGSLQVNVLAGANSVTGNVSIKLSTGASVVASGNDTISFGSGADTVVEVGTATVTAGATTGNVTVSAGAGANSVAAGAGNSTLLGGSGADTFTDGSGNSSMVGGSSSNVFNGATGHDTMVGAGASNLFSFSSTESHGTHTIDNFITGQDQLQLVGYTSASFTTNETGANTVLHFTDGTSITVVGYHLTSGDITY